MNLNKDFLRIFASTAFAFSLLLLYQRWEVFTKPDSETNALPKNVQETQVISDVPSVSQNLDATSTTQLPTPSENESPTADASAVSGDIAAIVSSDLVRVGFDKTGSIVRLELLDHLIELEGDPFPIFRQTVSRRYLPQTGLLGESLPSHLDENWRIVETSDLSIKSQWTSNNVTVNRTYNFTKSSYIVAIDYEIINNSDAELAGHAYYQFLRDTEEPIGYLSRVPSFYGAAIYTDEDKYSKYDYDEFESYPKLVDNGWLALVERYFLAAWLDSGDTRENYLRNLSSGDISVGIIRSIDPVGLGSTVTISQQLYAGALEQKILKQVEESAAKDLALTVDYGFLAILASPLFSLLELITSFVNNWGISIVLLTVLIKLVFFPLSAKSYRSMARMRNVAPQLKKIKERCGDDRQAFQKATMDLYRTEKINPLGGCLPILIQIPVFIALYWMLLEAVELRQAPLGLWIQDLSSPDPFFVLPVILGIVMLGQFKLNPTPPDPTQAMIMKLMPLGFAAFSIIMPSGLVLYWITNTMLSIAQQWIITRNIERAAKS